MKTNFSCSNIGHPRDILAMCLFPWMSNDLRTFSTRTPLHAKNFFFGLLFPSQSSHPPVALRGLAFRTDDDLKGKNDVPSYELRLAWPICRSLFRIVVEAFLLSWTWRRFLGHLSSKWAKQKSGGNRVCTTTVAPLRSRSVARRHGHRAKKTLVYTIFLGKQGKRVYTIEASDPEKDKRRVSTVVVHAFFFPESGPNPKIRDMSNLPKFT